jgi:hypothetical protein
MKVLIKKCIRIMLRVNVWKGYFGLFVNYCRKSLHFMIFLMIVNL